jgi:hypothetical protein
VKTNYKQEETGETPGYKQNHLVNQSFSLSMDIISFARLRIIDTI